MRLRDMTGGQLAKLIGLWIVLTVFLAAVIAVAIVNDEEGALAAFFIALPIFAVQVQGILLVGLLAVWISQRVRNTDWFDRSPIRSRTSSRAIRSPSPSSTPGPPSCSRSCS